MFKNYLRIAFRNIKKHKGYTFINVFGLALGVVCCLAIFVYVDYERSYDTYHSDLDLIYRVAVLDESPTVNDASAQTCAPTGQALRDHFPQIEKVARVLPVHDILVKRGDRVFYENHRMFTETELFSILTIPFLKGNSKTALDEPGTLVLTREMAKKYFGEEDPLGKTLEINGRDYAVTGVVQDAPHNTHLKYDFFVSLKTLEGRYPLDMWFLANFYTYVKVRPDVDIDVLADQMVHLVEKYSNVDPDQLDGRIAHFLQPVADIHLYSHLRNEPEPGMRPQYLYIFSAVGIFILLIACVNFINLSTARSAKRAREVGMRKVIGAYRMQLVWQFMSESLVVTVFAVLLALFVFERTLPLLRELTQIPLMVSSFFTREGLVFLAGLTLFVAIVAGGYPSLVLSGFRPAEVLKSSKHRGMRGAALRKLLVVGQFTLSIILIIGTGVVYQQIHFMKNEILGFDPHQKLVLPLRGPVSIEENYESVKSEFLKNVAIQGATASDIIPGQLKDRWGVRIVGLGDDMYRELNFNYIDTDFISEYDLSVVTGRSFDRTRRTDIDNGWILNMAAVRDFGWSSPEEALGKRMTTGFMEGEVIGVIRDFHYRGLQSVIEPLVLIWRPSRFEHITLTVDVSRLDDVIGSIRETWEDRFSGHPFEFYFLDEAFDEQYRSEERISKMVTVFAAFGLFIACLGLFGLASFTAQQKTKEIGIRKVLGASLQNIVFMLTREFTRWVLVANVAAWPVAYFVMERWLQNFAYRIDIGVFVFFISACIALIIALLTVGYQAVRAALTNPVDSIRYE